MRKGIAVSPGVAVGKAYCIHEIFVDPDRKRLEEQDMGFLLGRTTEASLLGWKHTNNKLLLQGRNSQD